MIILVADARGIGHFKTHLAREDIRCYGDPLIVDSDAERRLW